MTETQRKIKEYQQMLPGLKERVMAVAVLLMVSMTMVVSASFAWITLSRAPEVSMMSTTVAANGNLEIALVDHDGLEPEEVAIGDSSATEGQTLVGSNITWGNLVNLSDGSYGLDQIDLRPALLSGYNLDTTPLYGATYSADGRVQDVSATYQYASWTTAEDGTKYFAAGKDATYGVRAISSVKYENISGNAAIGSLMTKARNAYATANSMYLNLINGVTMVDETRNISCMDGLAMLLEIFVNEKADSALKSGGDVYYDYKSVVTYTYRLLLEYQDILDAEGEALLLLANLQAYANNAELGTSYFKSVSELTSASAATLKNLGVSLESLTTYKSNCTSIQSAITGMEPFAIAYDPDTGTATDPVYWADSVVIDGATVTVDGIGKHVSKLVDVNTTTANGVQMNKITISNALTVISDPLKVVINKGVLKDTEQRLGDMLKSNNTTVTINVSAMSIGKKTAWVSTAAASPFLANNDMGTSASMEATGQGDAISLDTYGIAIDLWVRTNAEDSILILEGSTLYEEVEATCTNKNGEVTALYMADGAEEDYEVYLLDEEDADGNTVTNVYDAVSHTLLGAQSQLLSDGFTISKKMDQVVAGFEGENRVWKDWRQMLEDGLIDENSTTQGAGSCYVFYANPSDQTRILDLLKAFTIAFLDQSGNHIATAKLDTENYYAINGKVTVPMIVTSGTTYIDADGNEQTGIRNMPRNTPTWLTAIIYLDGMQLTNENVLAAGEIEGRLNFQFGSASEITAMGNLELQQKYRIVSAVATSGDMTSSGAENESGINFEYDGEAKEVTVTLTVEGDQPNNISAFFVRSVGASQGTRTEDETFTKNADGTWSATFGLTKPGDYKLQSVVADGVEYILDTQPSVHIEGLAVTWVYCNPGSGMIMTADSYVDVEVQAEINADPDLMPSQVRALFRSEDGKEYTAIMAYDPENAVWVGTARITSSGTYTWQYLVMDGDYTELEKDDDPATEDQQKTLIITLGLKAIVQCTGILDNTDTEVPSHNFVFEKGPYDISMRAKIVDDGGNEIKALENVGLYYWLDGGDTDQDGMYAGLTWDGEYYKGAMEMENAGTYYFDRIEVVISGNPSSIRKASSSPVFSAMPPDPPRYEGNATTSYQFVPSGGAVMAAATRYAQAANVWAVIENVATGQTEVQKFTARTVDTMDTDYCIYTFPVPLNNQNTTGTYAGGNYNGFQDGEWVIKELWLQNVYDEDQNYYGNSVTGDEDPAREDCLVMDVYNESKSAQENNYTYVVHKVVMSITEVVDGKSTTHTGKILGKDGNTITGTFMQEHTLSGLTMQIYDWNNQAIRDIQNVALTITHGQDSKAKGGYTTNTAYTTKQWTITGSGRDYTLADETFQLAGTYNVDFSFSVGSETYSQQKVLFYEVWSITPTVTVTSVGTSAQIPTQITWKFDGSFLGKGLSYTLTNNKTNSLDTANNTVTVYAQATTDGMGTGDAGFVLPTLKFTVAGVDASSTVKFTIPAGSANAVAFSHTGNGESAAITLGKTGKVYERKGTGLMSGITYTVYGYYGHGDQTISQVTIERNGVTYTVYLEKPIVIHNQSSTNQTS